MGDIAQVFITCKGNRLVVTRGLSPLGDFVLQPPQNPVGAAPPPEMGVKPQRLDQSRMGLSPSVCPSPSR